MERIVRFFRDEEGGHAAEYALIIALIAVAIIGAATLLGTEISNVFGKVTEELKKVPGTGG